MTVLDGDTPRHNLNLPLAARRQIDVTTLDYALTDYARLRHDRIRWWWGERAGDDYHGALCYVCDRLIVTWDTRYPITGAAQAAIQEHRRSHDATDITAPASVTAGTSPAANAPTDRRSA